MTRSFDVPPEIAERVPISHCATEFLDRETYGPPDDPLPPLRVNTASLVPVVPAPKLIFPVAESVVNDPVPGVVAPMLAALMPAKVGLLPVPSPMAVAAAAALAACMKVSIVVETVMSAMMF